MSESFVHLPVGSPAEPLIQVLRFLKRANLFWSRHCDSELFHRKQIECAVFFYGLVPYIAIFEPLVRATCMYNHNPVLMNVVLLAHIYVSIYSGLESLRKYNDPNYKELSQASIRINLRPGYCTILPPDIVYWYLRISNLIAPKGRCLGPEILRYHGYIYTNGRAPFFYYEAPSNYTAVCQRKNARGDHKPGALLVHSKHKKQRHQTPIENTCADYLVDAILYLADKQIPEDITCPKTEYFGDCTSPRNPPRNDCLIVRNGSKDDTANIDPESCLNILYRRGTSEVAYGPRYRFRGVSSDRMLRCYKQQVHL